MTVGSGAHLQVSNHSQDQCACMSKELKEYEPVHNSKNNKSTQDYSYYRCASLLFLFSNFVFFSISLSVHISVSLSSSLSLSSNVSLFLFFFIWLSSNVSLCLFCSSLSSLSSMQCVMCVMRAFTPCVYPLRWRPIGKTTRDSTPNGRVRKMLPHEARRNTVQIQSASCAYRAEKPKHRLSTIFHSARERRNRIRVHFAVENRCHSSKSAATDAEHANTVDPSLCARVTYQDLPKNPTCTPQATPRQRSVTARYEA